MAYAPHIRVTAIGTLGTSKEMFQYGISIHNGGTGTLDDLWNQWLDLDEAVMNDVATDVSNFHGSGGATISSAARLRTVKLARLDSLRHYVGDPKLFEFNTPGAISHNASVLPQNALAISLNTALRGPRGRGRFFIPMPVVQPAENLGFLVSTVAIDAIADAAEAFIEAVNNHPGIDPLIASPQVVVASSSGVNSPVTSVRVGRVVDTIRSRRNRLPEMYQPNQDVD